MSSTLSAIPVRKRYSRVARPLFEDTESQLRHYIVLSSIVFTVLGIWILWMGHNEREHRLVMRDIGLSFELTCPHPEPTPAPALEAFRKLRLEGHRPAPHSAKDVADLMVADKLKQVVTHKPKREFSELIPQAPASIIHTSAEDSLKLTPAASAAAATARSLSLIHGGGLSEGLNNAQAEGGSGNAPGQGDQASLEGGDFGAKQLLSLKAPSVSLIAMGNIRPYKNDVIARIKQHIHPAMDFDKVTLEITLDHQGHLLGKSIVSSTGNPQLDEELLAAVSATSFAPLPEWYGGQKLIIRVSLIED